MEKTIPEGMTYEEAIKIAEDVELELQEKIKQESEKVDQSDKVEPVVDALKDMGDYYKKITTKLVKDGICFVCKKKFADDEEFKIIQVPNHKTDAGLIAFVSVCKKCNEE